MIAYDGEMLTGPELIGTMQAQHVELIANNEWKVLDLTRPNRNFWNPNLQWVINCQKL